MRFAALREISIGGPQSHNRCSRRQVSYWPAPPTQAASRLGCQSCRRTRDRVSSNLIAGLTSDLIAIKFCCVAAMETPVVLD